MKYFLLSLIFHGALVLGLTLSLAVSPVKHSIEDVSEPVAVSFISASPTPRASLPSPVQSSSPQPGPDLTENKEFQPQETSQEPSASQATYIEELRAYLDKNKKYPTAAVRLRHSGVVQLKVMITKEGVFKEILLESPSTFETLNQAAVSLVSNLKKFKPLPAQYAGAAEFIIPIDYRLKGQSL
jgi:periplasmic protein TonB